MTYSKSFGLLHEKVTLEINDLLVNKGQMNLNGVGMIKIENIQDTLIDIDDKIFDETIECFLNGKAKKLRIKGNTRITEIKNDSSKRSYNIDFGNIEISLSIDSNGISIEILDDNMYFESR